MRRSALGLLLFTSCGFHTGEYLVQFDVDPVETKYKAPGNCPASITEKMACAEEARHEKANNIRCTSPRLSFSAGIYGDPWPFDSAYLAVSLVEGVRVDERGRKMSDGSVCYYRLALSKL